LWRRVAGLAAPAGFCTETRHTSRCHPGPAAAARSGVAHAALFDGPVDVVDREALKFYVAPAAMADAIHAF
jgi:hypothetical protein